MTNPIIYQPKGKAGEYSKYGCNLYNGCDSGCLFCYCFHFPGGFDNTVAVPKENVLERLKMDAPKYRNKQVFLSFLGDPYCKAEIELGITRQALEIFLENRVPVMILTKGGGRIIRDMDLFQQFGENIVIGMTLTTVSGELKREPGAMGNKNRINVLRAVKKNGIKTWVSAEPVIDFVSLLKLIEYSSASIDHYKIGKMNHHQDTVDWKNQGIALINLLEKLKINAYIKDDTAKAIGYVPEKYRNRDSFTLQGWKGENNVEQKNLFE